MLRSVCNRIEFLKAKLSAGGCDTLAKVQTQWRYYGGGAWLAATQRNTEPALTMHSGWHSNLELRESASQSGGRGGYGGGWGGGYGGGAALFGAGSKTQFGGAAVDAMWKLWERRMSGQPEDLLGRVGGQSFLYFYEARTSIKDKYW